MIINKDELNRNFWWEDEQGHIIDMPEDVLGKDNTRVATEYGITYHSLFPLEITEHIDSYAWCPQTKLQKFLCQFNWCYRILEKKHHTEKTFNHVMDCNVHIGGGNQEVIMAMVNSGDYTLSEALMLWSQSCERCMNVLAYKYLDGRDGYPEYSQEWKQAATSCRFCAPRPYIASQAEPAHSSIRWPEE